MLISIIVAAAENGVIGSDGGLPWRIPSDLKRFRAMTMGKPVVMGRKTFLSLPKALDGRDNIVVTREAGFTPSGAITAPSLEAALVIARDKAEQLGANAVIGVDIDYETVGTNGSMLMVTAAGTAVRIE